MSPMWRCRAVLPRVKEAGCGLTRGFHRSIYRPKAVHRGLIPPMPDVDWIVEPGLIDYAERSEEHTSELQSLMRISYAVFCLKKKKHTILKHRRETPQRT